MNILKLLILRENTQKFYEIKVTNLQEKKISKTFFFFKELHRKCSGIIKSQIYEEINLKLLKLLKKITEKFTRELEYSIIIKSFITRKDSNSQID